MRRAPPATEPDFPTPGPRRSPWAEPEAPAPLLRRAPISTEPDLPTPPPRSAQRAGRAPEDEEQVLSVADLDRRIKRVVEGSTENVKVAGEVSNLKAHASGHIYFTLKDEAEDAAIDCVMYRTSAARSRRVLEDGARVVVRGRATVFVPRGRLQLIVDDAQLAGRGALLEALERLKEKLQAEGLFDPARKRPLPTDAKVIGVVTSASGAAIHDIIKVAFARGAVRLVLARAPVQGRDAAPRMAKALATLGRMREVEAIIVGRGGGSADDLLAFNDEVLVREAARCRVPVVSAVGHEVDVSLLDLVADARAATPSQAAEMLVPDASARRGEIAHLALRMRRALGHRITTWRADVDRREGRLLAYPRSLDEKQQGIDDALGRIEKEMGRKLAQRRASLQRVDRALWSRHPRAVLATARHAIEPLGVRLAPASAKRIAGAKRELDGLSARLALALERRLSAERGELAQAASRLSAMSPLSVLARGYAIATKDGRAVRSAGEVAAGDRLRVRLHEGAVVAQVIEIEPGGSGEAGRR